MSLRVGKVIYSLLINDSDVGGKVKKKVYPLIADQDTTFPFIVYKRISVEPINTKDKLSKEEEAEIEIVIASDKYEESIDIAQSVREALNGKKGSFGNLEVKGIYFISADEDYIENTFIQKLNYKIILWKTM